MSRGGSKPQLVRGSNGKKYVVKLIGNPSAVHRTRLLANEYVVGRLAKILDVPSPPVDIIHVDESFVNVVNTTAQYTFKPGPAFGSLFLEGENVQRMPANSANMIATSNARNWPNAIVLDALAQNEDLKPDHILITKNLSSGSSEFWHVDHGHCLAAYRGWNTLTNAGVFIRNRLYPELVSGSNPFEEAFQKLREITPECVDGILGDVPLAEWEVPSSEVVALKNYLETAKDVTPNAITSAKRRYARWV
jgi:hypothetical protein